MNKKLLPIIIICFLNLFFLIGFTQTSEEKISRQEYIEKFKEDAIKEMNRAKIPASITLAQGILESGNGNSNLAKEANNHFGIKCHLDWEGERYFMDDDEKNECFRKYSDVYYSFKDHSNFLTSRDRYAFLFQLEITDYKAWANGLKKAGYATNPKYPELLIKIIEENKLYELDKIEIIEPFIINATKKDPKKQQTDIEEFSIYFGRKLYNNNGVNYIIIEPEDTYYKISKSLNVFLWQLYKYNDLDKSDSLEVGQKLYLQPKKRKAQKEFHIVTKGETMHSISQDYAIKLKHLYKKNSMPIGKEVIVGQKLWLKNKKSNKKAL